MLRDPLRKVATLRIRGWGARMDPMSSCPLPSPSFSYRTNDNTLRDSRPSALLPSASSLEALEKSPDSRHLKLLIGRLSKRLLIQWTFSLGRGGESSYRVVPSLWSCWCNFGRASDAKNLQTIATFRWDWVNTSHFSFGSSKGPAKVRNHRARPHQNMRPGIHILISTTGPLWQLEVVCPHRQPAHQPRTR